jgi:hypothetical protein
VVDAGQCAEEENMRLVERGNNSRLQNISEQYIIWKIK